MMNFNTFKTNKPAIKAVETVAESLAITAFIAGCTAIIPFLSTNTINWQMVGLVFVVALVFSAAHGIIAYLKPYNAPLADVLETIVSILERKYAQQQQSLQGSQVAQQGPLVVIQQAQNTPTEVTVQPRSSGQTNVQSNTQRQPEEHPGEKPQATQPLPVLPKL